jgi:hypothetical protein
MFRAVLSLQVVHARTCSKTSKSLAAFLTTCHLIYSAEYDTATTAADKLRDAPKPRHQKSAFELGGHDPFEAPPKYVARVFFWCVWVLARISCQSSYVHATCGPCSSWLA